MELDPQQVVLAGVALVRAEDCSDGVDKLIVVYEEPPRSLGSPETRWLATCSDDRASYGVREITRELAQRLLGPAVKL